MNANIQQLRYLIEIERTRSISQAASNLYIGQPNLSRIVKDLESSCGFAIFERTRRGVRPTEKGAAFLNHARNILREVEFIENLGSSASQPARFRVCIPRSYTYLEKIHQFLSDSQKPFHGEIRECHPRQALDLLENGNVEIAVIRFNSQYQDYFTEQIQAQSLSMRLLDKVPYMPVLRQDHPLAKAESVTPEQLTEMTEIIHRDIFPLQDKQPHTTNRIYAVDRMAQLQLLLNLPNAYLLSEPLPRQYLDFHGLTQLPCDPCKMIYQEAVIYKPQCAISELESDFLHILRDI